MMQFSRETITKYEWARRDEDAPVVTMTVDEHPDGRWYGALGTYRIAMIEIREDDDERQVRVSGWLMTRSGRVNEGRSYPVALLGRPWDEWAEQYVAALPREEQS